MANEKRLPPGYHLEQDSDGDWLLVPPNDVTIFSEPGEPLLIGHCDRADAMADALAWLAGRDRFAEERSGAIALAH
jgi:hypothetical protein